MPLLFCHFYTAHVFLFNSAGLLMVQQIARDRPHALQWGSSVATFVRAIEDEYQAAQRALYNELDLTGIKPSRVGRLEISAPKSRKHVTLFTAVSDGPFALNPYDGNAFEFLSIEAIENEIEREARAFTATFLRVFDLYCDATR